MVVRGLQELLLSQVLDQDADQIVDYELQILRLDRLRLGGPDQRSGGAVIEIDLQRVNLEGAVVRDSPFAASKVVILANH